MKLCSVCIVKYNGNRDGDKQENLQITVEWNLDIMKELSGENDIVYNGLHRQSVKLLPL